MRRLYFLLPDANVARMIVAELKEGGVPERHLHCVASLTQSMEGLPEAGMLQRTELVHGLEFGILFGALAGFIGGWLTVTFPPPGLELGMGAMITMTLLGAFFGALVKALVSSQERNHLLDRFEAAIERGQILLMVDVPKAQVEGIKESLLRLHPGVDIRVFRAPRW